MLSTRFGYGRPAARALARASALFFGDRRLPVFLGFFFFQGGRVSERDGIEFLQRRQTPCVSPLALHALLPRRFGLARLVEGYIGHLDVAATLVVSDD